MRLLDKVEKYCVENKLIETGDRIVVGVSGGPDSLCLLNLLNSLKEKYSLNLTVVHINHLLRDEADFEEEFVREFSSKYYIVRTAWLYGYVGHNFVYTMMKLGKDRDTLSVVNDQLGNPTNANDLAYHILKLIETEEYGVYHCTGKGECSWYDFASEIMKLSGRECKVNPCTSAEYKAMYPNSADRPAYSSLDNMMLRCTVGDEMRDWKEALKTFMDNVEK